MSSKYPLSPLGTYAVPGISPKPIIDIIITEVCAYFDISEEKLKAKSRLQEKIVFPRMCACYFISKYIPKITEKKLGEIFNQERTTARNAIHKINGYINVGNIRGDKHIDDIWHLKRILDNKLNTIGMTTIKLSLNKSNWENMRQIIISLIPQVPVEDYEIESLVIIECYKRKLQEWTFFEPEEKNQLSSQRQPGPVMVIDLTLSEAYSFNVFLSFNEWYNVFIRPQIEPKLPSAVKKPLVIKR